MGDMGCNGGLPYQAYMEIERLGGLVKEEDYPYTGTQDKCTLDKSQVVTTVTGREQVSTGINANMMQFYTGGVAHPWRFLCNPSGLDHGVLMTGYGVENGVPYWMIKNSWSKHWGEDGYYKLYRGDGSCGCNQMVTSAIV